MSTKIVGEPNDVYHSNGAISHSKLCDFMEFTGGSPMRFFQRHVAKTLPRETGEHFDIGSAWHLLMEDAEKYKAAVVDQKYENYRTNEARAWRDAQQAAGKIILNRDQALAIAAMHGRVAKHALVQELVANTEAELTWRKNFGAYSVQCRTDRYRPGLIVDWKTVVSIADFKRDVINHGYHTQDEFYRLTVGACEGMTEEEMQALRVVFVAVEKEPPYEVQPFELDADSRAVARAEIILALKHLKRCFETGDWNRPERIEPLRLPNWFARQREERLIELRERLQLGS